MRTHESVVLGLVLLVASTGTAGAERLTAHVDLGRATAVRLTLRYTLASSRAASAVRHAAIVVARPDGIPVQRVRLTTSAVTPSALLAGIRLEDIDFDGYLDFVVSSDVASRSGRLEVWRYDPVRGRFVQNQLTRALSRLTEFTVDSSRRRIVVTDRSPGNRSEEVYRVDQGRLRLEESCVFESWGSLVGYLVYHRPPGPVARKPFTVSAARPNPCAAHRERIERELRTIAWAR
jgi:hypothetical protein